MSDNNTISAPEDFPIISEKQANSILDNLMGDLHLHDDKGEELVLSTVDKLKAAFGDKGVVVAQLILVAAARGFDHGFVASVPGSDRTDILARALRQVHVKEMYGDCQEDGDPFPCRTIRALDLVAGAPAAEPVESDDPFDSIVAGFESA